MAYDRVVPLLRRSQHVLPTLIAACAACVGAPAPAQADATSRLDDRQAPPETWKRIELDAAGLRLYVPNGFTKLASRPFMPIRMRGKLGGGDVELRVTWLTKSFATTSRALLALSVDARLDRVRAERKQGRVTAIFESTDREPRRYHVGLVTCPRNEALGVDLVFKQDAPATTRAACRSFLRFVRLVPRRGLTVVAEDEETRQRAAIARGFPEADRDRVAIRESAHYRLFTTAPVDEQLLELLEQELLPRVVAICGVKCRRNALLPIFLHKRRSAYILATMRLGLSAQQVEAMEGHAWDQYYSTWYSGPRHPVHIHEGTHQYVTATLGLDGGGPWLQEGFARWVETQYSRETPARNARNLLRTRKDFPTLRALLASRSFLLRGNLQSGDGQKRNLSTIELYDISASFVQYLAQEHRSRFRQVFLQCGVLPSGQDKLVVDALERCLGMSFRKLEADWKRWLREDL